VFALQNMQTAQYIVFVAKFLFFGRKVVEKPEKQAKTRKKQPFQAFFGCF